MSEKVQPDFNLSDPESESYKLSRQMGESERKDFTLEGDNNSNKNSIHSLFEPMNQPDEEGLKSEFFESMGGVSNIPQWRFDGLFDTYQSILARLYANPLDEGVKAQTMKIVDDIVFSGEFMGKSISPEETLGRWTWTDFIQHRSLIAELYLDEPELTTEIFNRSVVGAHGSTSASLLGVLDHGLRPQEYIRRNNIPIASGEGKFGSANLNNKSVSLAQWTDYQVAQRYSRMAIHEGGLSEEVLTEMIKRFTVAMSNMDSDMIFHKSIGIKIGDLRETLNFLQKPNKTEDEKLQEDLVRNSYPVIYFIGAESHTKGNITWKSKEGLDETAEVIIPLGDITSEFCIVGGVPIEGIRIIFVPEEEIAAVESLIAEKELDIKVFDINRL